MRFYPVFKRLLDVALSLLALALLSPLWLLIALLIRLGSPGAVIYRQVRTGRNGKEFMIYKFRSMVENADQIGPLSTSQNDPRITPLGRFLRRTGLDELPQLVNVLLGDMSLIGPRPNTPSQQSQYSAATWEKRHHVRPGITGLAQVSGRSNLDSQTQSAYDLTYVETLSFFLDCRILFKTVQAVISGRGTN
jgi:lipopolysaccharide/colanic/teichoic acid biosynthesis glycosyltransferase